LLSHLLFLEQTHTHSLSYFVTFLEYKHHFLVLSLVFLFLSIIIAVLSIFIALCINFIITTSFALSNSLILFCVNKFSFYSHFTFSCLSLHRALFNFFVDNFIIYMSYRQLSAFYWDLSNRHKYRGTWIQVMQKCDNFWKPIVVQTKRKRNKLLPTFARAMGF
jgi:hypothetical protein